MEIPEKTCEYCTHFRFSYRPNCGKLPIPGRYGVCHSVPAPMDGQQRL